MRVHAAAAVGVLAGLSLGYLAFHDEAVFGNGFGARGDLEKLQRTSGFSPYAKDAMSPFGFSYGSDPKTRFFGVSVMPPGDYGSEELRKRVAFRVRQMEEASRPATK